MEIKTNHPVEQYSAPKIIKFPNKNKYKNYRSWLTSRLALSTKRNNFEAQVICIEMLNAYNHFHPKHELQVEVDSWQGKSSFEIIKNVDSLTVIKYQKVKGGEPKQIRTEISKQELDALIEAIKIQKDLSIDTRDIAFEYCKILNYFEILNGQFWKNFFSNRKLHNKFTLMLGSLDKLGLIEYKAGKTKIINLSQKVL